MFSEHCSECGEEVTEFCPDHPSARVESIWQPSDDDLIELEAEAVKAHDVAQVELCQRAYLARDPQAIAECARVILAARANDPSHAGLRRAVEQDLAGMTGMQRTILGSATLDTDDHSLGGVRYASGKCRDATATRAYLEALDAALEELREAVGGDDEP